MQAPFRLGFIGAGYIARFQSAALRQVRGVDITAVHAPKGAEELSAHVRQNGLGPCEVCPDIRSVCDRCDAVAVFAPNHARLEVVGAIVDAVKAGSELTGIICEKPLGRTVAEARELVRLIRGTGLKTAYLENQLHMRAIHAALAQLAPAQEAMGPMTLARSAEEHAGPHEGWFWDPVRQGGGVLSDMGCHSIAMSWFALTPWGQSPDYLRPVSVNAETALLKWGLPRHREDLLQRMGVDYAKTPAEDFATGIVTFKNPETGQLSKGQFTNSWMYDKQGLRLLMEGIGPGYAFELNSLRSPLEIFIGDAAATAAANVESALEKSTASRGLLAVQPNEPDLYGYVNEMDDAVTAFREGREAFLPVEYGLEITLLCQAAYMSAERGRVVDLTDPDTLRDLETYTSLIAQGRGAEVLFR